MPSIVDNVHGCALDIQGDHPRILFTTTTNALLASLIVKHTTDSFELFDDLLTIIRHPEFNPRDISMRRTEDFLDHIAEQRRATVRERGTLRVGCLGGIPQLIVDLVADQLYSDRIPFYQLICHTPNYYYHEAERTLRTMTLVHRSWATSAQRCLRRRIFANSNSKLRSLLQTPLLGPWVRELCIGLLPSRHRYRLHDGSVDFHPGDALRLLCQVIRRSPNLKAFYVSAFNSMDEFAEFVTPKVDFFEHLCELRHLKMLWLHQQDGKSFCEIDIDNLRSALPHLSSLEFLSLDGWYPHNFKERLAKAKILNQRPSSTTTAGRCNSLKALSLNRVSNPILLTWLGKNCVENPPEALELSFRDTLNQYSTFTDPLPCLRSMTQFITKLVLRDYESGGDISSVLEEFQSLQSLCIYFTSDEEMPNDTLIMPDSVRSVHFHHDCLLGDEQERYALSMLRVSPHIRRLVITSTYHGEELEHYTPTYKKSYRATKKLCRRNRVGFEIRSVDSGPTYLDI